MAVFIVVFVLYYLLLLTFAVGWKRAIRPGAESTRDQEHFVTVIVAARNEENTIRYLLEDLDRQQTDGFEVLVVDDHSDDRTSTVVATFAKRARFPLKIVNPGTLHGKKNCISAGVSDARGSVIVTTDADCRVGKGWIACLRQCFDRSDVQFVSAGVRIRQQGSLRAELQAAEFVSLVGTGAASIGLGCPTMCNGANMAFRRMTFQEVNGYEGNLHIASGDDEFLMRKIDARYPGGVIFCSDPASVVETAPVPWPEFLSQRIRWAGKWTNHGLSVSASLAIFIFTFHLTFLALAPVVSAEGGGMVGTALTLVFVKAVLEYWFLQPVGRFLGLRWNWITFLLLQLAYPLYAVALGILANIRTPAWKGRKIKRRHIEMPSRFAENR